MGVSGCKLSLICRRVISSRGLSWLTTSADALVGTSSFANRGAEFFNDGPVAVDFEVCVNAFCYINPIIHNQRHIATRDVLAFNISSISMRQTAQMTA